jgi:hypothetical protein
MHQLTNVIDCVPWLDRDAIVLEHLQKLRKPSSPVSMEIYNVLSGDVRPKFGERVSSMRNGMTN